MKSFSGSFELFEIKVRRLRNGNKLSYVFEAPENLAVEKELIELRGENVKAVITQDYEIAKDGKRITLDGTFEVFEVKCRRLRNGDKLMFTLEQSYEKSNELKAVNLRFDQCQISMQSINEELPFPEDGDEDIDRAEVDA
jgi:hypothetical protein